MNILIVDSASMIRSRIKEMLEELSYIQHIQEATNTQQALTYILDRHWDIIIIEMKLSDGCGLDIIKYIRHTSKDNIQIIMICQEAFPQYEKKAFSFGANYYISKINDISRIISICDEIQKKKVKI